MFKKLITSLALLVATSAFAGGWVTEKTEMGVLVTTVSNGRTIGMSCLERHCQYFAEPASCEVGQRVPVLLNAATRMGVVNGGCMHLLVGGTERKVLLFLSDESLNPEMGRDEVVTAALPSRDTNEISVVQFDFGAMTNEQNIHREGI